MAERIESGGIEYFIQVVIVDLLTTLLNVYIYKPHMHLVLKGKIDNSV